MRAPTTGVVSYPLTATVHHKLYQRDRTSAPDPQTPWSI